MSFLVKLWHFGITGDLWYWFRAYLTNRKQYVSINNYHSTLLPVIASVQQGSILGPLLFLVFINDLPDCVLNSTMLHFADDAKCSLPISSHSNSSLLQNDLDVLTVWSKHWNLFFNESKCSLVRFGFQSLRLHTSTQLFIIISHLVPTVRDQHPITNLFTNLRELMLPRTHISIDSHVCGTLSPLSISTSVSCQSSTILNNSFGINL